MTKELITISPYGAYQFEFEIKVVSIELIPTEQKTIEYKAECACIVDKDDYNEYAKEILVTAMREYCKEIIQIKKIHSVS